LLFTDTGAAAATDTSAITPHITEQIGSNQLFIASPRITWNAL
jgi:hypothetical protein